MKNLMRTETEDGFGLKNLQNVILNIAQYVDSLCQEYDINYRLMGDLRSEQSAIKVLFHGMMTLTYS